MSKRSRELLLAMLFTAVAALAAIVVEADASQHETKSTVAEAVVR